MEVHPSTAACVVQKTCSQRRYAIPLATRYTSRMLLVQYTSDPKIIELRSLVSDNCFLAQQVQPLLPLARAVRLPYGQWVRRLPHVLSESTVLTVRSIRCIPYGVYGAYRPVGLYIVVRFQQPEKKTPLTFRFVRFE